MSLAEIFYAKHPRRSGVSHRPRRDRRQHGPRNRVLFEPLESRLLLAADPTMLLVPPAESALIVEPAVVVEMTPEPPPPPLPPETSASQDGADGALDTATADTGPYPVPLDAIDPLGSLIYDPAVAGSLDTVGETDTFTLALDAGQTLTVRLSPGDASLRGRIEVLDPGSTSLGIASAAAAGDAVILQTVAVASAGTYSLLVTSLEGSGAYEAQTILNAALEAEAWGGAANDAAISAQDIGGSAVDLQGTADRRWASRRGPRTSTGST